MAATTMLYRCLADEQLDHAIDRLHQLVQSLDREGPARRIADDYRRALDLAKAERERRRI